MGSLKDTFEKLENDLLNEPDRNELRKAYNRLDKVLVHQKMTLICLKKIIEDNYINTNVELLLNKIPTLTCDIFGKSEKGKRSTIIEIETGYYLDSNNDITVNNFHNYQGLPRIDAKISRYSHYADEFGLGVLKKHSKTYDSQHADIVKRKTLLKISRAFTLPPYERNKDEIDKIKEKLDKSYKRPKIERNLIENAKIDFVYVVDLDNCDAQKIYLNQL